MLVCCDGPEVAAYREVNAAAVAERVPWLKAAVDGFEPTRVPPSFRARRLVTCYELRTRANWNYYEENMAFEYLVKAPRWTTAGWQPFQDSPAISLLLRP